MKITEYIRDHNILLDGGMGTLLQSRGLKPGELPERWNITHSDDVAAIHRAYFDAGSNVVISNTFGANTLKYEEAELDAIIKAALSNVRRALSESSSKKPKWAALDIGPLGRLLKPYGDLDFEEAVKIFSATACRAEKYGADLIFIETMNDSYETKAALLAAKENSNLPVFVSNAYGADGKLMTGASPAAMVAMLEGMGADCIGMNCSLGPKALWPVAEEYLRCASVPVLFKPNAGLPKMENGMTVYDLSPEKFAEETAFMACKGVRALGGCCGTTPAYIKALSEKVPENALQPLTDKERSVVSSYTHAVTFGDKPLLIGERINPTGKKKFQEELRTGSLQYALELASTQQEQGADILDVNVGIPGMNERTLLPAAVFAVQSVCDLPLQIDTSSHEAMEAALRLYNGKPVINSVNGKKSSMAAVFPLVKKYGGVVVALTLDEKGVPETAEERFQIAEKILIEAQKAGIAKKDILFDPLCIALCTNDRAAAETLRAVELIRGKLGVNVVLGVSNVSFGLPERSTLNAYFLAAAIEKGLSAAIINPCAEESKRAFITACALKGYDPGCEEYIRSASSWKKTEASAAKESVLTELQNAIVRGYTDAARELTEKMLTDCSGLAIIEGEIIPALDSVGRSYEKQDIFLPQLLMSAEAAGEAFSVIRAKAEPGEAGKGSVILATVHGDIHDIGKNIVRLLLENYGYNVIDLGKDVPPEVIAERAESEQIRLVGLSALMTTTVPAMEETIKLLRIRAPQCLVVVGGAVLTQSCADLIGADHYAPDAMDTVRYTEKVFSME